MKMKCFAVALLAMSAGLAAEVRAEVLVEDAYARAAMPTAPTAAIFMTLRNTGSDDMRLVSVATDVAARTELHTHLAGEDGVMRMRPIDGGLTIPAGGSRVLARGGDHVMMMGVTAPLEQGATVTLMLGFDGGEDLRVDVPVDLTR